MRRRQHSRAGLFLIELIITILFFSITAAICMRVFVKSHQISQDADCLFHAQAAVSSVAEILEGSKDFFKDLSARYPDLAPKTQTDCLLYLDDAWEGTTKEKASYSIDISWQKTGDMTQVKLQAFAASEEDFFHQEIYHLDLQIYNVPDGLADGKEAS